MSDGLSGGEGASSKTGDGGRCGWRASGGDGVRSCSLLRSAVEGIMNTVDDEDAGFDNESSMSWFKCKWRNPATLLLVAHPLSD